MNTKYNPFAPITDSKPSRSQSFFSPKGLFLNAAIMFVSNTCALSQFIPIRPSVVISSAVVVNLLIFYEFIHEIVHGD